MIVLSRFRFFVTFVFSLITNCLFLSVLLTLQNKQNQPASCYYFIKITNNKCYTKLLWVLQTIPNDNS